MNLELIRGSVRPLVTLFVVGVSGYMVVRQLPIPEVWVGFTSMIVTWWFLSRKNGKG